MIKEKKNFIADTVHGSIRISEIEKEIISSQIFNRLHNIYQNSTAYLTFPTNRTKRFEHSIGTMHLAGQMFFYSILNAQEKNIDGFFEKFKKIIFARMDKIFEDGAEQYKNVIHDKNYQKNKIDKFTEIDFLNGIQVVDEWIPHNIKENQKYMYMVLIQSVRLAALLHDVGHPPFSHITENAMKEVWQQICNTEEEQRCENEKKYYSVIDTYFKDDGELHEKIGNRITERLLSSLLKPMPADRNSYHQKLPIQLYRVMLKETTNAILDEKNNFFQNIHNIISGSLDADRLDYVTRDFINSGLNVGRIEYDRLIPMMKLMKYNEEFYFCPSIKSIGVLEDFFNRRWNLYKKIIFHHRVIKTDYLLHNCILELLQKNLKNSSVECEQDEILPYDISGLWLAVEKNTSDDMFFNKLSQWDDGWLMVVLKKTYMSLKDNPDDELLKDKLNELLASQKHYYSMVKNEDMFLDIENEAMAYIRKEIPSLKAILIKLEKIEAQSTSSAHKENVIIDPFCEDLNELVTLIENYNANTYQKKGFCLKKISDLIFNNYFPQGEFQRLVKQSIEQVEKDTKYSSIRDVVVEFKQIKSGIQESLMLYDRKDDLVFFKDVSNTAVSLNLQRSFVLPFYIYVNIDNNEDINYSEFRKDTGKAIGENVVITLKQLLNQWVN